VQIPYTDKMRDKYQSSYVAACSYIEEPAFFALNNKNV